ncbi:MAG: type II toxin-antitoxin system Phd/YefM family antitoxin [Candidatus Caldatribacteriota bacterium]
MPVFNDEKGKKTAAILPLKKYKKFMVREDLHDLAVIAERRDEPSITFDKLKERLIKNGLL